MIMVASMQTALVYVEGPTDVPVISAIMSAAGWLDDEYKVISKNGGKELDKVLRAQAHKPSPIPRIFLRDSDGNCPVITRNSILPRGSVESVVLRICDTEIESWLLADSEAFARFFNIPLAKVELPDGKNAKERMLRCVDRFGKRNCQEFVKKAMKDGKRDAYRFGARYRTILEQYVEQEWDAGRAALCSDSLNRALRRLRELRERAVGGEFSS